MKKQINLFNPKDIQKSNIKIKTKNSKKEEKIQISVCKYLKMQYPDAIFTCDLASGMKLTIGLAAKHKSQRSGRGYPDLCVDEPRRGYNGLRIELKSSVNSVFLKDGKTLKSDPKNHLKEQIDMMERLKKRGYYASFGLGFDDTKRIIDWYFSLQ